MSKKCRAYSESKLGLEPADNRKAFYAGWDAAIKYVLTSDMSEKHVHESDKHRHEKGTSQENRQVAMRRTTRDEKIVNPGVYEVPEFECPRCGHCCQQVVDDLIAKIKEKDQLIKLLKEEIGFAERGYTKMGRTNETN